MPPFALLTVSSVRQHSINFAFLSRLNYLKLLFIKDYFFPQVIWITSILNLKIFHIDFQKSNFDLIFGRDEVLLLPSRLCLELGKCQDVKKNGRRRGKKLS